MKYYRVELPVCQIIPFRDAEEGMELMAPVFGRDGKMITDGGKKLTDRRLQQFKNHNIREITVLQDQTQWIPADQLSNINDDVEILEEKEFSEAAQEIINSIVNTNSVQNLRYTAEYLQKRARENGNVESQKNLDEVIQESYALEDQIESLAGDLQEVDDEEDRKRIYEALEGSINELKESFMEISTSESLRTDCMNALHDREKLKTSLTDIVNKNPEIIGDSSGSTATESDIEVDGLPQISDVPEWMETAISELRDGNISKGIFELIDSAESLDESELSQQADNEFYEILQGLERDKRELEDLKEGLFDELHDVQEREKARSILERRESTDWTGLEELPLSDEFEQRISDLLESQTTLGETLWDTLNEYSEEQLDHAGDKTDFVESVLENNLLMANNIDQESMNESITDEASVLTAVEDIQENDFGDAIEELKDRTKSNDDMDMEALGKLKIMDRESTDIEQKKSELEDAIEQKIDDPEARTIAEDVMEGNRDPNSLDLVDELDDSELAERVKKYNQDRAKYENSFWDVLDEFREDVSSPVVEQRLNEAESDTPESDETDEAGESTRDYRKDLKKALACLKQDDPVKTIKILKSVTDSHPDFGSDTESKLISHREDIETLNKELNELKSDIETDIPHPRSRKILMDCLDGDEEFDPGKLLDAKVDITFLERVENYINQYNETISELKNILKTTTKTVIK